MIATEPVCVELGAESLVAYVRGELALSDALALERHVGACACCAAALAQEASHEAALYELGEIVDAELRVPAYRAVLSRMISRVRSWAVSGAISKSRAFIARRGRVVPPAWGSLALASALVFVVCDHAAMQGLLDETSPAPGAIALRSRDAAPLDEAPPQCEEPALMGVASPDGPACLEPIAMATFPPDDLLEGGTFDGGAFDGGDVCRADDDGELVCADDTVAG